MSEENRQALTLIRYTKTRTIKPNPVLLRERRVIMGLKNDPYADVFRMLRTTVLRQMREHNWNSLAIVAPTSGNGKTFVTANLAIALALEVNQTVLIVDADLRRPTLGWYFGLNVDFGLLDYLNKNLSLEEVLVNPGFERLVVLPGKDTTSHSSELLSSPRMAELVKDLRSKYHSRIIVYDLPPLLAADDALLFMSYFDAALLVVEDGKNTVDEIRRSLQMLEGTNLVGVVLNKAKTAVGGQYYGGRNPSSVP